jgi:hypothetical protein
MPIEQIRALAGPLLLALTLSSNAGAQSAAPDLTSQRQPPPRRLSYDEGQPIPDGYRLRSRAHRGLLLTGAIMGGAAYSFGVIGAFDSGFADNSGYLLVPIAGPWLMIAAGKNSGNACPLNEACPTGSPSYQNLFVGAAGVLQAVGAVLFIAGMTTEQRYLERQDVEVSIVPASLGNDGYGLGAIARF